MDRALREALKTNPATQSVIISVNPGCRAVIRQANEQHGDAVRSEHEMIDAVSARIHSADVAAFAQSSCVKAVSSDASVHAVGLAGLIGSSGKLSNYEYQGVAPDIHPLGLEVLDSHGAGRTSDVIKAIEFVVANRAKTASTGRRRSRRTS